MRKSTTKTNYKPVFRYMAKNKDSRLTNYSDSFNDKEKAFTWYENYGRYLENRFNRILIFKELKLQISNSQL